MDLAIRDVVKTFGPVQALRGVSLDIPAGDFFCFLGPSGCGKTTLLRVIAGLEAADSGSVVLGGRDLSAVPARLRDFGMVFQSYSLFPNMTAARNVGYGLECRGRPKAEIADRATAMLKLVHLSDQAHKLPSQLSGGQQQRVALARALAIDPALLLLDEPLSALDAKVREDLRGEIRALQRRLGITTIMVTHDQEEALTMADTVVVMRDGGIEQIGTPTELYARPATAFVAGFIGRMNLIETERRPDGRAVFAGVPLAVAGAGASRLIGIRPEEIELATGEAPGENRLSGTVTETIFLGNIVRHMVQPEGPGPAPALMIERQVGPEILPVGAKVGLRLPAEHLRVLG
ncbi:ABC transporter ATP-binding protein [Prosthecomicrobium sp. N25]|uniref:ABC transporter ATP-binding protein n=1 Tax=Prosthecomicrobium sp. N25 TaxID=3129254 RepID=UPI0030780C37